MHTWLAPKDLINMAHCVCIYIYTHTHIHTHTYTYTHIQVDECLVSKTTELHQSYTHMYAWLAPKDLIDMARCIYIHTHEHTHIHTNE
jgi:hypothetical protein